MTQWPRWLISYEKDVAHLEKIEFIMGVVVQLQSPQTAEIISFFLKSFLEVVVLTLVI